MLHKLAVVTRSDAVSLWLVSIYRFPEVYLVEAHINQLQRSVQLRRSDTTLYSVESCLIRIRIEAGLITARGINLPDLRVQCI